MNFKKNLAKSVLINGGYGYSSQAVTFLASVVISRLLSPETFGFVGIISIFTGFISIFSDSGITLAVIKTDYKYTFYKAIDDLSVFIGIVLCLITCIAAYPIALFFKNVNLFVPILVMSST